MPTIPPSPYRWATRTIHPPEADEIGRKLKIAGMNLDSQAYFIQMVKSDLEQCWNGQAKERFFEDYGFARLPDRLEELGAAVQNHGAQIMEITVTVTEQVPIEPEDAYWG